MAVHVHPSILTQKIAGLPGWAWGAIGLGGMLLVSRVLGGSGQTAAPAQTPADALSGYDFGGGGLPTGMDLGPVSGTPAGQLPVVVTQPPAADQAQGGSTSTTLPPASGGSAAQPQPQPALPAVPAPAPAAVSAEDIVRRATGLTPSGAPYIATGPSTPAGTPVDFLNDSSKATSGVLAPSGLFVNPNTPIGRQYLSAFASSAPTSAPAPVSASSPPPGARGEGWTLLPAGAYAP